MDEYQKQKQKQISSLNCLVKTRKLNTPVCISSYPIYTQRWQPFAASSRKMPWTHLICNLSCWLFFAFLRFCFSLFIVAILQIKSEREWESWARKTSPTHKALRRHRRSRFHQNSNSLFIFSTHKTRCTEPSKHPFWGRVNNALPRLCGLLLFHGVPLLHSWGDRWA